MPATTNSNLEIARRAHDEARADFATWQMMVKLNSADALPLEAQKFLASYRALLERAPAAPDEAAERTIQAIYRSYYSRYGGTGSPPDTSHVPRPGFTAVQRDDNVTPFRKIKPDTPPPPRPKRRLPVALIFILMVAAIVGYRLLTRGTL